MPSTYTTNNGIEKIGTGEQSGTWGDTTNLNFDILDQALDGLVTITATDTGSSGSPNTLPITDGTLSDGRNRLIIITDGGDLGGSVYYQLTPADAEKIVFLRNSLSGSQDLILFQGTYNAARDLIVPAGKDVIVKFSGTGTSTAVVAPVFADLSLDAATIASADINGGTIDGVTIGVTSVATVINVDNLKLDGNTLSSTDTNGNVVLAPNGDGDVQLDADTVRVGDSNNDVTITTNGTGDLTLNTNGGTDSGSIEIQDGANTNIIVTANGTGKLELANGDITTSAASGSDAAGQDLTIQAGASTGNAAGGDMIFQTTPAGAGSGSVLNSYTTVLTLTDDSKMQIGTSTAVDSILDEDDMNSDSATALATQQSIKAYVDAQVGANNELSEVLANGNTTGGTDIAVSTGDDITFADNSKAIFGAGSDLEIYHDTASGDSIIKEDSVSGGLKILGTNIALRNSDSSKAYIIGADGGALTAYYNGSPKLATTGTGVDITGNALSSDTFEIDSGGVGFLVGGGQTGTTAVGKLHNSSGVLTLDTDGSRSIQFSTGGSAMMRVDGNGNGIIINESGADQDFRVESDADANMLWVDAGQNRVKIATASDYGAGVLNIDGAVYFANSSNKVIQGLTPTGWGYSPGAYGVIQLGGPNTGGTVSIGYDPSSNTSGAFTGDGGEMMFAGEMDFLVPNTTDTDFEYVMRFKQNEGAIFNEKGWNNIDFRVESDTKSHMLFVDASSNKVGIGSSSPQTILEILDSSPILRIEDSATGSKRIEIGVGPDAVAFVNAPQSAQTLKNSVTGTESLTQYHNANGVVVNEGGADRDFRVESDSNVHALFVDAGNSRVGINTSGPTQALDVSGTIRASAASGTSGVYDTIAYQFSEGRGWGYNNVDDAVFYNGADGKVPFLARPQYVVINESSHDTDFRVESDSNANMLFVDAGADKVKVATNSDIGAGSAQLQVGGMGMRGAMGVTTNTNTGIPINQGSAGGTALIIANRNYGAGTQTQSQVAMITFYYDGNNTPSLTHIAGTSGLISVGTSAGTDPNKTLTLSNTGGGNCTATFIMNC